MNKITGKVWNFGANIDTDVIIAARYLNSSDPEHLAKYVMEDADPEFPKKLQRGDVIVAGENFGCGSSREHAPIALKAAGVAAVVAPSFARIFYRKSVDGGFLVPFETPASIKESFTTDDEVEIDVEKGTITNITKGQTFELRSLGDVKDIIEAGGLFNYAKNNKNI